MTGRRLEADLGGIRRTREWGFSADDMAAVLAVLAIAGEWS